MSVRSYTVWGASCDSCDADFETLHPDLPCDKQDLADFGWVIDDDNALCPTCATREGAGRPVVTDCTPVESCRHDRLDTNHRPRHPPGAGGGGRCREVHRCPEPGWLRQVRRRHHRDRPSRPTGYHGGSPTCTRPPAAPNLCG